MIHSEANPEKQDQNLMLISIILGRVQTFPYFKRSLKQAAFELAPNESVYMFKLYCKAVALALVLFAIFGSWVWLAVAHPFVMAAVASALIFCGVVFVIAQVLDWHEQGY